MSHDGGTSPKWLMYHVVVAAAAGDEDERDKRERERDWGDKTTTRVSECWCCMPN